MGAFQLGLLPKEGRDSTSRYRWPAAERDYKTGRSMHDSESSQNRVSPVIPASYSIQTKYFCCVAPRQMVFLLPSIPAVSDNDFTISRAERGFSLIEMMLVVC